jgi:two-component system LytT family response regulator
MPGSTGFDLITRLGSENKPYIVFTTAHMNHALLAFEVGALDYLVKPIEQERFHLALGKMRNRISAAQAVLKLDADGTTRRTGESVAPAVHEPGRIAVHMGRALKILESQKITHVMAEGDYLDVHFSDGGCLKVRDRMHSFECRLASSSFLRIHRSILINKAHVSLIEPSGRGLIRVVLSDGTAFVSGAGFIDKVNLWLQQLQNPATAVN